MVNRGGLKVFPDEVEEHLRAYPGVADAAVAGVPDERLGEVPWAFLVVEPSARGRRRRLREWCRERMAAVQGARGCHVVDALPRNEIGKLLRQELVPLVPLDPRAADVRGQRARAAAHDELERQVVAPGARATAEVPDAALHRGVADLVERDANRRERRSCASVRSPKPTTDTSLGTSTPYAANASRARRPRDRWRRAPR